MDNRQLGKLVVKQVKAFPESFFMGTWINQCGTVACLAGHTLLLSGYAVNRLTAMTEGMFIRPDGSVVNGEYGDEAAKLLGMDREDRFGCIGHDIFLDMENGLDRFTALAKEED